MKKLLLILILLSGLYADEIQIISEDGFELHGWLDKPSTHQKTTPLILFAHQFGADHTLWTQLAQEFNAKGFATLNVDLRGHGKSILQNTKINKVITDTRLDHIKEALVQSSKKVGFEKIPADLTTWLEYISEDESIDMKKIYLFGSSLGAGSLIPLLNEYEAKGLVAISPGKPKGLEEDVDMALGTSMTKILFIASKNDPLGANQRALEYTQKSIAGTLLLISGDRHGTVILPEVQHYIFSFIENIK